MSLLSTHAYDWRNANFRLTVFVDPTLSYAFVGQIKTTFIGLVSYEGDSGSWCDDNGNLNTLNISANFGFSADFQQVRLYGGYNMDLTDINKSDNSTTKISGFFDGVGRTL